MFGKSWRVMRALGIFIVFVLLGSARAHVVEQLFFSVEKTGNEWEIVSIFDAAYSLPEFRDDADMPQPKREWLFTLSNADHIRLRDEAEKFLRESLVITHAGVTVEYDVDFPDYDSSPPSFPQQLNGCAYITMRIRGVLPEGGWGEFVAKSQLGKRPDLVMAAGPENAREYHVLKPGDDTTIFTTTAGSYAVEIEKVGSLDLLILGYEHVLPDGLDHLLFILGLFLMARKWKALLAQSLAFTVAHSITLGLAVCGWINVGESLLGWTVEPLIALSIAVIAIENLFTDRSSGYRLAIVFGFGLIHGLGFAGSLATRLDQSGDGQLMALALANLGVELAQVTVLGLAWVITIKFAKSDAYPKFRKISSIAIAGLGMYWAVERVLSHFS